MMSNTNNGPVEIDRFPNADVGQRVRVEYDSAYGGRQELTGVIDRVETEVGEDIHGGIFHVYVRREGDEYPSRRLIVLVGLDDVKVQGKNGARWQRVSATVAHTDVFFVGGESEPETDGGEPTKEELDAEWYFNAKVDRACQNCGHEPTRRYRVRPVFGTPTCSDCFHQRRRGAPAGDAIGSGQRMATDGGQDPSGGHWESVARDDVAEGERVRLEYESITHESHQERVGEVTSVTRRGTGGLRYFKVDTGAEYDDGTPKVISVSARGDVRTEGRKPQGRRTIGRGADVSRYVDPEPDGGDNPKVVIPGPDSSGGRFHQPVSPCALDLANSETVPVNNAQARGFTACPHCDPPTFGRPENVRADGGLSLDELAQRIRDAVAESEDVALAEVAYNLDNRQGCVDIQYNGFADPEEWQDLRERLIPILEREGFNYKSESQLAFLEVYGLETVQGGGEGE